MKHMNRIMIWGLMLLVGAVAMGWAQEQKVDRAVVPLSDPSKPATIEVKLIMGGITVKGYGGKEVIVEARVREYKPGKEGEKAVPPPPPPPAGSTRRRRLKTAPAKRRTRRPEPRA